MIDFGYLKKILPFIKNTYNSAVSGSEKSPAQGGTGGEGRDDIKLCLQDISKSYRFLRHHITALDKICLKVRDGEFICVLGPSGCGKTTLLNLIAGLDHPDGGEIFYQCRQQIRPRSLIVFQENALFPWLNAQQNVEFGLKMKGMPKKERAAIALEYLNLVRLGGYAQCYMHQLSGGMKQRVALARILALEPEILLMDEPFAALDLHTRRELSRELQDIWEKTGNTIIFVTHQLEEAVTLGDRVVLLTANPGRIKTEISIELPRPRRPDQPSLLAMIQKIAEELPVSQGIMEQNSAAI